MVSDATFNWWLIPCENTEIWIDCFQRYSKMIKEFLNPNEPETYLASFNQKWLAHMLTFFDDNIHVKRYYATISWDTDGKKSHNLIGLENFRTKTDFSLLCTMVKRTQQWIKFVAKAKKILTYWPTEVLSYWQRKLHRNL